MKFKIIHSKKNEDLNSLKKFLKICDDISFTDSPEKYVAVMALYSIVDVHLEIEKYLLDSNNLHDIQHGILKILIFITDKGDPRFYKDVEIKLLQLYEKFNLPTAYIGILTCQANPNAKNDNKASGFPMDSNIKKIPILEYNFPLTEFYTSNHGLEKLVMMLFDYFKNKKHKRLFHYSCFNGTFRDHRSGLFYLLLKNDLLKKGIYSYTCYDRYREKNLPVVDSELKKILQKLSIVYDDRSVQKMIDVLPCCTDSILEHANNLVHTYDINLIAHFSSYFNISTSSSYDSFPYLDDKTYKPILTLQPFFILGDRFSLKILKEMGFKTFHPFIDETYDGESDKNRLELIKKEVFRLSSMTIADIHEWYWQMEDILLWNEECYRQMPSEYDFWETVLIELYHE